MAELLTLTQAACGSSAPKTKIPGHQKRNGVNRRGSASSTTPFVRLFAGAFLRMRIADGWSVQIRQRRSGQLQA